MYNAGTVTTTANSTKLIGTGTKWKDNNSRVSAEQVILIQNGATIYINSIASIQSNTEITLSFPVPASVSNAPYQILTTMVNSVSDAANKVVAMNVANVQFSDILNRWVTESGTITVTLPDGTTQQLRTAKEMDKQLDGKFDKKGGVVAGNINAEGGLVTAIKDNTFVQLKATDAGKPALLSSPDNKKFNTHNLQNKSGTVMHIGDCGFGGLGEQLDLPDWNSINALIAENKSRIYNSRSSNELNDLTAYAPSFLMQIGNTWANISINHVNGRMTVSAGYNDFKTITTVYSTANTTKDSNGNLKAASPIVKVFADHIELNEESEGVEMERLGVGHYLIKGVVGFNADGAWGINNGFVIPQDHNGKNMVLIDYEVKPDGDIEVFVFHQQNADLPERFQNKRIKYIDKDGNPVYYENYEPCDVPESRWIDMRVEMPVNSIYNLKQAEAERLAKEAAEKQAEEEAKKAELEAEEGGDI
ncbi:phage tail fiber protein [Providencia stuartii]|uniref:phage tail fiber protein n=1 Tax=Providencia stuartii TaxID=588 RepID=UPI0028852F87|nr:hypothetical protein [Providencia stuartii]MDT1065975.1 hypothetical protein [Providencia stuartii]